VLDALAEAGVGATFCIVGRQARAYPDLVRAIRNAGHTLCTHTMTHPRLTELTPDQVEAEIAESAAVIENITGSPPAFFRAPYGAVDATVIEVAHRHGMRVLGWSVDPRDYERRKARRVARLVVPAVRPGGIVLLHDGGGERRATVRAIPKIVNRLRKHGITLVTPPSAPLG
jgi:peptidoglycan-N-acetylglucosamine deacetylase